MKDVVLVGGPHEGKRADGDALVWYVGMVLEPMNDGHRYRRGHHNQAHYEGLDKAVEDLGGSKPQQKRK